MSKRKPSEEEKYTAFYYSFSPKELRYFLFGKKTCPRCGGKLQRHKEHETVYGWLPGHDDVERIDSRKVKHHFYTYSCERCRAAFTLAELAGENRRNV